MLKLIAARCFETLTCLAEDQFEDKADSMNFNKADNMNAAMERFCTTEDKMEIIMHMQQPVQFETDVFKKAFQ